MAAAGEFSMAVDTLQSGLRGWGLEGHSVTFRTVPGRSGGRESHFCLILRGPGPCGEQKPSIAA